MNSEFKPFYIAKRIENRILIGLAAITATIILVGWVAINENARMEEFTERAEGRSIEAGARIFENNCSTCHAQDGRGLAGVAPALNNPVLFGYNYFADVDTQLVILNAQLGESSDADQREALRVQIGELEAEREAFKETILYDWTDEVAALDEQIADLDAQIVELEGVDNPSRLTFYIEQRKANEIAPLQQELDDLMAKGKPEEEEAPAEDAATTTDATDITDATADAAAESNVAVDGDAVDTEETTTDNDQTNTDEVITDEVVTEETATDEAAMTEGEATTSEEATTEGEAPADTTAQEEPTREDEVAAEYPLLTPEEVIRFVELENNIAAIEEELKPYEDLADARANLVAQRGRFQAVMDAHAEVEAARAPKAEVESQIAALEPAPTEEGVEDPYAAEREALTQQAIDLTKTLNDATTARQDAYDALVETGDILDYDPDGESRLVQVGWAGSLRGFLESTITGGRPTSKAYWPNPMPAWGQVAGGSLRPDQITNLTNFILNWDRDFTIEDVRAVRQFARIPTFGPGGAGGDAIGTENVAEVESTIEEQLASEEITPGDPTAGQATFTSFGCSGCHAEQPAAGPMRTGLWTRVTENQDNRLSLTGHEDDPEGYVIQSILAPSAFVVPGFSDGVMPQTFKDQLSYQDLVNILAYLETLD